MGVGRGAGGDDAGSRAAEPTSDTSCPTLKPPLALALLPLQSYRGATCTARCPRPR